MPEFGERGYWEPEDNDIVVELLHTISTGIEALQTIMIENRGGTATGGTAGVSETGAGSEKKKQKTAGTMTKMFKAMGTAGPQAAALQLLMTILGPVIELFEIFSPILEIIGVLLQAVFLPVFMEFMPIIQLISKVLAALIPHAMKLWGIIKYGFLVVIQFLWGLLVNFAKFLSVVFVAAFIIIWTVLKAIGTFIATVFVTIWRGVLFVFQLFGNILRGFINFFIDIINFMGNLFTLGAFVDIPHLAQGGIVTKPTVAMIGEAGPEKVTPLNEEGGSGFDNELYLIDMVDGIQAINHTLHRQSRGLQRRRLG